MVSANTASCEPQCYKSWNLVIKQFVLVKRVDDAFLDNNKRFYAPAVTVLMARLGNNSLRMTKRHFPRKKNNPNHSISLPGVHLQVGFNENFSKSNCVWVSFEREDTQKGFSLFTLHLISIQPRGWIETVSLSQLILMGTRKRNDHLD